MAWTEVCKLNFESAVKGLVTIKKLSVAKAIQQLSDDSEIPRPTLRRWWNDLENIKKELSKNGQNEEGVENTKEKENEKDTPFQKPFQCRSCKREDVNPKLNGSGKPIGPKSKFYQLCSNCVDLMIRAANTSDGMKDTCPHCGNQFIIKWSTVTVRMQKHLNEKENKND